MGSSYLRRIQTFAGLAVLLIVILLFILMLILQFPKEEAVVQRAQALKVIPTDFFTTNPVTEEVRKLSVPANVPVNFDANNLGRPNVFEQY